MLLCQARRACVFYSRSYSSLLPISSDKNLFFEIKELNIGHFLIGDAIFSGLKNSILKMKEIIREARK